MTSPLPGGQVVSQCMMDALRDAGIEPAQIDYINAHASSTQLNDANESMCIRRVFDAHADHLAVSGTKAYTAHPLGATGAIEAALCALALERGCIPPTLNWRDSDPACTLDVVPNHVRTRQIGYAMSNAFGFGGINSCVVMSRSGISIPEERLSAGFLQLAVLHQQLSIAPSPTATRTIRPLHGWPAHIAPNCLPANIGTKFSGWGQSDDYPKEP